MSKLIKTGYNPTHGFFAVSEISAICFDKDSKRAAIVKLKEKAYKEFHILALRIQKECDELLLSDQQPCSELTPRVYLTAWCSDTHSCLGDEW